MEIGIICGIRRFGLQAGRMSPPSRAVICADSKLMPTLVKIDTRRFFIRIVRRLKKFFTVYPKRYSVIVDPFKRPFSGIFFVNMKITAHKYATTGQGRPVWSEGRGFINKIGYCIRGDFRRILRTRFPRSAAGDIFKTEEIHSRITAAAFGDRKGNLRIIGDGKREPLFGIRF